MRVSSTSNKYSVNPIFHQNLQIRTIDSVTGHVSECCENNKMLSQLVSNSNESRGQGVKLWYTWGTKQTSPDQWGRTFLGLVVELTAALTHKAGVKTSVSRARQLPAPCRPVQECYSTNLCDMSSQGLIVTSVLWSSSDKGTCLPVSKAETTHSLSVSMLILLKSFKY